MTLALRAAPSSHRYLSAASDDHSRRIGRISSGLRIMRAADDVAGFAIANRLRAHANGSATATRNVHEAINLLGTAEGGLQGVTGLLQRARELSVQAASTATMTAAGREAAAAEVRQIVAEVDRIAGATQYNGMRLLDGSRPAGFSFHVGASPDEALTVRIADMDATALGLYGGSITTTTLSGTGPTTWATASKKLTSFDLTALTDTLSVSLDGGPATTVRLATRNYGTNLQGLQADLQEAFSEANPPIPVTVGLEAAGNGYRLTFSPTAGSTTKLTMTGSLADALGIKTTETTTTVSTSTSTTSSTPALADLVAAGSADAILACDAALGRVTGERSNLGAWHNRLEHRLGVLAAAEQNLGSARSRIEDADLAVEYMAMVRAQILREAGMALQSQQVAAGQRVLQLLTGR